MGSVWEGLQVLPKPQACTVNKCTNWPGAH